MADEPRAGESLTNEELAAVIRVVQALVDKDTNYLREIGAYDQEGDPYVWTRRWRLWDHVDLIVPPGDPRTWVMGVYGGGNNPWVTIDVQMWTEQEGLSELILQVDLKSESDGTMKVVFRSLHVM